MPRLRFPKSCKAVALMSMATVLLSACASWQPISFQPRAVPDRVRVTTSTERVVLKKARLVGDSAIAGSSDGTWRSIRLVDIQMLEQKEIDAGDTILLVFVGIPVAVLTVAIACAGGLICAGLQGD